MSAIVVSLRSFTTMLNILPLSLGKHRYAFVRRNSNDQHPRCAVQHGVIVDEFPVSLRRGILWITDRYVQGEIVLLDRRSKSRCWPSRIESRIFSSLSIAVWRWVFAINSAVARVIPPYFGTWSNTIYSKWNRTRRLMTTFRIPCQIS